MLQSEGSLYLAGLFLRFGVPLGLTIILTWLLRNLDLHWLEQADDTRENETIEEAQLSEACWVVHNLSSDDGRCADLQEPCWRVRLRFEGNLSNQCLDCQFFKDGLLENAA
ncbi:MAG: hypothetical protein A2Z14_07115 [Chloroflexi bacterium RBG_16_48_8]|nr:MAG: hypothetical protein A2Z14_07115 [Chloroflexi bacterium RBG_16_48_8]